MFSVGTNFDKLLIDSIKSFNVYEIYGKLPYDIIGGCRQPFVLKDINKNRLEMEVVQAHKNHIEFNYLLNASCLDNREYSSRGRKEIFKLLDYLKEIRVDTLTVTIPYLAEIIKKEFSNFKISVSTLAEINTIKKFMQWQELGVDSVTLDLSANRDFVFLKKLNKIKRCEVKLMVNQCCESQCISYNYHSNINSHASQHKNYFPLEYCTFNCKLRRINDPSLLLKSPWIRPEDLSIYRDLGFKYFKIVQRQDPTEKIVRSVKAYYEGSYDGNLLDIMNFNFSNNKTNIKLLTLRNLVKYYKYLFKPFSVNMLRVLKLIPLIEDDIGLFISNRKLDKFIDRFIERSCENISCEECRYCNDWVEKVIVFNKNKRLEVLENYYQIKNIFIGQNNSLFY